ncbi:MAG: hypothetical protein AB7P69_27125 [Candidatus Binatia bacterium]
MNAETVQHAWEWLLTLSKTQLILLGSGISLLVAVSKIMRFLFLLGLLVVLLTTAFPALSKHYENSPLPMIVKELMRKGAEATQDPSSPPSSGQGQPKK